VHTTQTSRGPFHGALIRQGGIFRPDVSQNKTKVKVKTANEKPGAGLPLGIRAQSKDATNRNAPYPSSTMSSGRLFLDRVARSIAPLHRHEQINLHFSKTRWKKDISTLPGRGHFYFALTFIFL
jgi:hypothetical protein